jgi:hypothetical protein
MTARPNATDILLRDRDVAPSRGGKPYRVFVVVFAVPAMVCWPAVVAVLLACGGVFSTAVLMLVAALKRWR